VISHGSPFSVDMTHENGHLVLWLSGSLDATTNRILRRVVKDLVGPELLSVTVDLDGLAFVDAAGIQAVLEARPTAGAEFRLRPGDNATLRLIRLANIQDFAAAILSRILEAAAA
jgi:anti-anti-sigma factor